MVRRHRAWIAAVLALIVGSAAVTSGLGARCRMMGHCAACPEWVAASEAGPTIIASHLPCGAIAPAAPRMADTQVAHHSIAFAAPAVCAPAFLAAPPVFAVEASLAPSFSHLPEAPPGHVVLRV